MLTFKEYLKARDEQFYDENWKKWAAPVLMGLGAFGGMPHTARADFDAKSKAAQNMDAEKFSAGIVKDLIENLKISDVLSKYKMTIADLKKFIERNPDAVQRIMNGKIEYWKLFNIGKDRSFDPADEIVNLITNTLPSLKDAAKDWQFKGAGALYDLSRASGGWK